MLLFWFWCVCVSVKYVHLCARRSIHTVCPEARRPCHVPCSITLHLMPLNFKHFHPPLAFYGNCGDLNSGVYAGTPAVLIHRAISPAPGLSVSNLVDCKQHGEVQLTPTDCPASCEVLAVSIPLGILDQPTPRLLAPGTVWDKAEQVSISCLPSGV